LKKSFRVVLLKQKFPGLWHSHNQRSLFKFILMKQQRAKGAASAPFCVGATHAEISCPSELNTAKTRKGCKDT